ncbi:unnamed protein product [Nesidiocoris tenuis]|uniref:Uncharacterized protein n=1 Tax=Nesidiocoris tenuis TaxID=355587 RepID=A0A6H5GCC4_9HEMI|nr:unnamed protein product [Nesidiocoris tenuis]
MDVEEFPSDWRHRMQSAVFASQQPKGERTHNSAGREAIRGFRRFARQGGQCCQHSRRNSDPRWDPLTAYKSPPILLEGGFEELLERYPQTVTNPRVAVPRRPDESSVNPRDPSSSRRMINRNTRRIRWPIPSARMATMCRWTSTTPRCQRATGRGTTWSRSTRHCLLLLQVRLSCRTKPTTKK